jgi:amidase
MTSVDQTVGAELCFAPATTQRELVRTRTVSCVELCDAHLATIERENPQVNAIVTLTAELARREAERADEMLRIGAPVGLLHGLPVAHKDFTATAGIRTTLGSPLYADNVPKANALSIQRLKDEGAVTLGKTNTPEFAAGSQTYNALFGATRNPYDLSRTSGGSSGGAAAALASGMVALADGTDMGGSLRNPASFCNVVGIRTSPGRVPVHPSPAPWHPYVIHGPMGRTVADVALMLAAMAGPDPRVPIALDEPGDRFLGRLDRDFRGVRVAWSRTLGGLPVEPEVTAALEAQRHVLETLGCVVEEVEPDMTGADEAFRVWRAWLFELILGRHYDEDRDQLGADVVLNVAEGRALGGPEIARAEVVRSALWERTRSFMDDYEFLLAPVVQVLPFDVELPFPTAIAGEPSPSYIDWMRSCTRISATGLPAASVPFAFSASGLPVGLQVIGRHQRDWDVLQLAHAIESVAGAGARRPPRSGDAG